MQANLPEPLTEIEYGIIFRGLTSPFITAIKRVSEISWMVGTDCVELKTNCVSVMIDPGLENIKECHIIFLNMSILPLYNKFTALSCLFVF